MTSPLRFDWFQPLPVTLKIASITGIVWLSIVAWPLAVATLFAAIVLNSMRDRKVALVLVSAMAIPALAMEGVWATMLISGVVDRQKEVELTYTVGSRQEEPVSSAAVRGAQDETPAPAIRVVSAVSGDTLKVTVNGEPENMRLIGIIAPEVDINNEVDSACFGLESYMFLNSLLSNQMVKVESDAALGDRDVDGSLLRYVWLSDGTSVNELMLEAGLARNEQNLGFRQQNAYMSLAIEAEEENKGLWASCNADGTPKVSAEPANSLNSSGPSGSSPVSSGANTNSNSTPSFDQPQGVQPINPHQ